MMEFGSLFLICLGSLASFVHATGPLLEADGWTPVASSQVVELPRGFLEAQFSEQRYKARSPVDRRDWREEQVVDADAALVRDPNDVEQDPVEWQDPSDNYHDAHEVETEKAPFIIYPEGSQPSSPSASQVEEIPIETVPSFLQPEPTFRRPLSPNAPRQPPPRFNPNLVRGPPRVRRPPLPLPPADSLPRSDVAPPAGLPRQLPPQLHQGGAEPPLRLAARPQHRPRPRPAIRPRPRPRPRPHLKPSGGGLLDGIYNAGKKVECATKNALSDVRLQDKAFVQRQLNCVLNKGHCDETGQTIKRLTPEIIRGICPAPCDECTNQQIRKIMAQISLEYPRQWQEILAITRNG